LTLELVKSNGELILSDLLFNFYLFNKFPGQNAGLTTDAYNIDC